jgi:hypothetical protein
MTVALIGSSMLKPSASMPKPCQRSPGLRIHAVAFFDAFFRQVVRAPDLEPPVGAPLLFDLAHRAAEVERFGD